MQPTDTDDQQVPQMEDAVGFAVRSEEQEHVVPDMDLSWPTFTMDVDRPETAPEEPTLLNVEYVEITPEEFTSAIRQAVIAIFIQILEMVIAWLQQECSRD